MSVETLTFTTVFHRILDFKNGVEFLFRPLFHFKQLLRSKTNTSSQTPSPNMPHVPPVNFAIPFY
jgi:hypothetical protein